MPLIDDEEDIKASDWLKLPEFHKISPDKKNKLLMADPEYAKMSPKDKMDYIQKSISSVPQQEEHKGVLRQVGDFAGTLGKDALSIPGNLYQAFRHPIDTGQNMYQQSAEQAGKAKEAFNQGNYGEMLARGAATFPMLGPMAANAGEEIGRGDIGTGLAHGAETLMMGAPRMIGAPVVANTVGKLPGVAPVARAITAATKAAVPAKVSKILSAAKEGFEGPKPAEIPTEVPDVEQFDKATRKVARPIKGKDAGRTTEDLNPVEPKQAPAPIDKSKMVKRGTSTDDLNVTDEEPKQKAAPIDKGKMVKRETTTNDLNPEKPLTSRKARQAERDELLENTRKVARPAKATGPGRTTDDLNPIEEQRTQKPAPVDKGIVSRIERAKKLTEDGEESASKVDEPEKTEPTEQTSPYSSETPQKPPITQAQIDAHQNEFRVPKSIRYANHFEQSGIPVEDVRKMTHEEWKNHSDTTGEGMPSILTIDKIEGEMLRRKHSK